MNRPDISVYGIVGSLRKESWNRKLMDSAARLAPVGVNVTVSDLVRSLPLFNEDLIGQEPQSVLRIRDEVAAADALIVATPEYNGGIPGVLKNAFDWISLPLGASVLQGKPVALIGTSPGRLGTARCQFELRNMFVFSQSPVMAGPELVMPFAHEGFDDTGFLKDEVATARLESLFEKLHRYVAAHQHEDDIV